MFPRVAGHDACGIESAQAHLQILSAPRQKTNPSAMVCKLDLESEEPTEEAAETQCPLWLLPRHHGEDLQDQEG